MDSGDLVEWENFYCGTCLQTRRFFAKPTTFTCETCSRVLERLQPTRYPRFRSIEPRKHTHGPPP